MVTTITDPKHKPLEHTGDLDLVDVQVEHYCGDAAVHERQKINDYCEKQSRKPGTLDFRFAFDDRKIDYQRQYGVRWSFHNYTNTDVIVIDRLGLPITLTPETRRYEGPAGLIIRKEMYFDTLQVSLKAFKNVQSLGRLHGSELTKMMPELGREHRDYRYGRSLSLEYMILETDIREADGRLYHLPTDFVVSFLSAADTIRHPCSPEYVQMQENYISNHPTGQADLKMIFRYINMDPLATPLYLRIANKVFMLKPEHGEPAKLVARNVGKEKQTQEVELAEYVELLYPAKLDAVRPNVPGYRCTRVSVEDAKIRFGICDNLEDARNPLIVAERIEQQHKDAMQAQAAEAAKQLRQQQEKNAAQAEELRKHSLTIEELKRARDLEMEKLREKNEREAHRRKMVSENIKLISVIATTAAAIAGIYFKLKKKE